MIRNESAMKRKRLVGIILSLVVGICLIAQPMAAFAEVLTSTVDNSVDKSTTRVMGVLKMTGCFGDSTLFDKLTVYDSEKVKVAYSNPTNDYVQSLINAAREKTERLGQTAVEGFAGERTLKPAVTEKAESSYDNRLYTWVKDNESDDGVLIGEPGGGAVGNQNRHMVIDGDYARTTVYTVTVEIVFPDHVWDTGEVTKEATETEDGVRTFTCEHCRETKTEIIPKLSDEQTKVKKPVYKGDIVADGMVHQFMEFYDFSGLPKGTVIILNIDGETRYISVPDELQRLEVREPVEIPFELELPQGYIFENNAGPSHIMYCTVRVLKATVVNKPKYKGDITADGSIHYMSEFYDFDALPEKTVVIVKNDAGDEIFINLSDLKNISGADPVDDSFTLSLPKGYVFADGSTRCICHFKILAPVNYTVTFRMNGHGTAISAQKVTSGKKAAKPAAPKADGFTFGGWYKDADCKTAFDFNTTITANTTVYAKWAEKKAETEKPDVMYGDVDGDKKVSAADARLALRRSVGLEDYKEGSNEFLACDVDHDGKVSAADARLILRASVGLEDPKAWKKA